MVKIILIVEDKPEEQDKAKLAVREAGYAVLVAATLHDAERLFNKILANIVGVITDLHFPETDHEGYNEPKLCGLAVVANTVTHAIPVAVCSDVNHHFASFASRVIEVLETHQSYAAIGKIPFGMDRKDWTRSVQDLVQLILKKENANA